MKPRAKYCWEGVGYWVIWSVMDGVVIQGVSSLGCRFAYNEWLVNKHARARSTRYAAS
jgi:hypothetical protein